MSKRVRLELDPAAVNTAVNNTGIVPASSPSQSPSILSGLFGAASSYFDYKASKNLPTTTKPVGDIAADELRAIELRNQQSAAMSSNLIKYGLIAAAALGALLLVKKIK
jgi:hypothetical protein